MKACALIRFFHPTNGAQDVAWDRLISQGVRQVEDAPTPQALAERLQRLLAPYAPQARLLLPGDPIPVWECPKGAVLVSRWRHLGVGHDLLHQPFTGATKDRSTRLAGVGMAWSTLAHFYPYWEVTPVDWSAALPGALQEAALAPDNAAYLTALRHLLALARDGHAWAYDMSAPSPHYAQAKVEIIDGRVFIRQRWGQALNLPLGGEVLRVDREPAEARLAKIRALMSASTPGLLDAYAAMRFFLGLPDQALEVEISDLKGQRTVYTLPASARWDEHPLLLDAIREIAPRVFLADVSRVDESAFSQALPKLVAARGLVFDLRHSAIQRDFLKHFRPGIHSGIQMFRPISCLPEGAHRTFRVAIDKTRSEGPFYQGKVAVLVGPETGSFGETCLEIVAANHLAPIVGSPTAGTEGDMVHYWLPGNIGTNFSGMKVLHADGSQFQGLGIQPTFPVKHTREALAAGRDEDVERALALIETGR
jgi:hypothetical protein